MPQYTDVNQGPFSRELLLEFLSKIETSWNGSVLKQDHLKPNFALLNMLLSITCPVGHMSEVACDSAYLMSCIARHHPISVPYI